MTAISQEVVATAHARLHSDEEVLERLYHRHRAQINSFCMRELGSREDADDATQLTFLNAYRGLSRGTVPEYETAWLFRIARNVCLNSRRSSSRRRRVEMPVDLDGIDSAHLVDAAEADELVGLKEVLLTLPALQREAILRREWQGMTYREIAADLGVSQAAIETAIFRARKAIIRGLEGTPSRTARRLSPIGLGNGQGHGNGHG
jgi:RNA polymerase sigma-70 factor (ECF subfamily)